MAKKEFTAIYEVMGTDFNGDIAGLFQKFTISTDDLRADMLEHHYDGFDLSYGVDCLSGLFDRMMEKNFNDYIVPTELNKSAFLAWGFKAVREITMNKDKGGK